MTDWDLARAGYTFTSRTHVLSGKLIWRVFRGQGFLAVPINDIAYPNRTAAVKAAIANYVVRRVS